MAQEGNGGRNAHHDLANKGEDSKESNGLGTKVHHVDLVMGEHRIEESRNGGNQTRPQGVGKKSDLRDDPIEGGMGCGSNRRPPALVEDGSKGGADLVQGFEIEYERLIDGGSSCRRRAG